MKAQNITIDVINADNKIRNIYDVIANKHFPANAAVMLKPVTNNVGELKSFRYIAVEGVPSTAPEDCVKTMLSAVLAEARQLASFASEFNFKLVVNGTDVPSGIRSKRYIASFLSVNTLYKSDSKGVLTRALECDAATAKFSATNLRVSDKQAIFFAKGENLVKIMNETAKAIAKQCTFFTTIAKAQAALADELAPKAEAVPTKKSKKTDVKAQAQA